MKIYTEDERSFLGQLLYGSDSLLYIWTGLNDFDQSKLNLKQQEEFPDWAIDYEEGYDKEYVKILTEAFFKDNAEMIRKLKNMMN